MAEYKKTSNIEESKMPPAIHFSKRRYNIQGSQYRYEIANTSKIGE